jgi:hypothetical protein
VSSFLDAIGMLGILFGGPSGRLLDSRECDFGLSRVDCRGDFQNPQSVIAQV